jgi:glycosyltransferase involved in cell wall biosynthesis
MTRANDDLRLRATVLVPTRDRRSDLERCLRALSRQTAAGQFEVVVIDDGSVQPVGALVTSFGNDFRVIRLEGRGPAGARNAGAAIARGPLLLLTDDDTEPAPEWVDAACSHLEQRTGDAGVEGPIITPPWDVLHEYTVFSDGPGAYLTCNVAYRAAIFRQIGGFFDGWPTIACEDHDLAYRVLRVGPIGFSERMRITHHPRPQSLRQIARRGLHAESSVLLFERHPDRFSTGRGHKWLRPTWYTIGWWQREAQRSWRSLARDPRRALRFAAAAGGQTWCSVRGVAKAATTRRRLSA